jgi:cation:H+ antiporter
MIWFQFAVCAGLILFSGSLLSRYADMLAEKTGMGRTWIGMILLATITSLPELGTGVSSVTVAGTPNIAVGDILGSCVFNLMLIGVIDLMYRPEPILSKVDQGHILSAAFGILLIGLAAWGLLPGSGNFLGWKLWFGPYTPLIWIVYGTGVRMVFQFEKKRMAAFVKTEVETLQYGEIPLKRVYGNVAFHAAIVVIAGTWLPFIGDRIAHSTGWGGTFVGNLLIAASTSLPEIVTSITAVRLAAPDLAIANLFGSNLFNLAILSVDDLLFIKGPLLSHVSVNHQSSAIAALMMTGIGITGLMYRTQKKAWANMSWDGTALLVLYLFNAYMIYHLAAGVNGAGK